MSSSSSSVGSSSTWPCKDTHRSTHTRFYIYTLFCLEQKVTRELFGFLQWEGLSTVFSDAITCTVNVDFDTIWSFSKNTFKWAYISCRIQKRMTQEQFEKPPLSEEVQRLVFRSYICPAVVLIYQVNIWDTCTSFTITVLFCIAASRCDFKFLSAGGFFHVFYLLLVFFLNPIKITFKHNREKFRIKKRFVDYFYTCPSTVSILTARQHIKANLFVEHKGN